MIGELITPRNFLYKEIAENQILYQINSANTMEPSELIKNASLLKSRVEDVQAIRSSLPSITDALAAPLIEYLNELPDNDCQEQLAHIFTSSSCENVKKFYQSLLDKIEELEKELDHAYER